ncbi:hypothetical protein HYQ45_001623 [Verticillium longisporum]|uniref:Cell wall protein n=1 Tax=Verticillium longisporum TaxID=100787 RepID=A0A8I2ZYW5_VERLO|nr:hypothetical protein HYQ45_001623 [Verticillium longisporum]
MARLSTPVLLALFSATASLASKQASGSTGPGFGAPGFGAAGSAACQRAVLLAEGIKLNIDDQNNEVLSLTAVSNALNANDAAAFQAAKTDLLGFVNSGIEMRKMNQAIAPAGNKAISGLAIVANAQTEELNLSNSLSGDPANKAADLKTVDKLKADFAGGIKQNMQNMADALSGCGGMPPPDVFNLTAFAPPPAPTGAGANPFQGKGFWKLFRA